MLALRSASTQRLAALIGRPFFILLGALFCFSPSLISAAEISDLTDETRACIKCHDKPGMTRPTQDGKTRSMHIATQAFLDSQHAENDCEDCHSDIDADTHGKQKTPLKNKRDFSKSMQGSCIDCHKKNVKVYNDGVHAAMIAEGSTKAPFCADCHEPHTLLSVKTEIPMDKTPCASCHKDIYKAYAKDVHGLARAAKGKDAPICADCHKAHDVKAASFGTGMRDTCLDCHEKALEQHKDWLPNAQRHFDAISCPACHAPNAERRVNLRLFNSTTHLQLKEKTGIPQFVDRANAADSSNMGLDERALRSLLKQFSEDSDDGKVMLQGRLEVRSGIEAHQVSEKAKAIKECDACHVAGAEPFQSVTVTIAGPDGRPLRHGVQKEVLNSLVSLESVRGFYAIGANRIKLLDWLLLLAVVGSIAGCAGHWGMRKAFRLAREKEEAARKANEATK
jgi:hypothetical protein